MTLGGLALAVGILVDEATVAVENIHSHLARAHPRRGRGDRHRETTLPRILAMVCILAVFVPAFFMVGAAKAPLRSPRPRRGVRDDRLLFLS